MICHLGLLYHYRASFVLGDLNKHGPNSRSTDTFDGRSRTAYKKWLAALRPTAATHEYVSFINKKVAVQTDGVRTTGQLSEFIRAFCPP